MSLPVGIPERTLGWGVLRWCSRWLAQPDGDAKGERWVFTDEQAMFILWFYAVDEYGQWLYRRGVLERPKGWGKSPLLAAICSAELLGPVKFDYFDRKGQPVGRPQPSALVQIAAISEDQTDNTLALVGEMLAGEAQERYSLSIMLSQVTAPGKRKLMRVTASPRSREGNRPTFVVMDETHLWIPVENGPQLASVLRRNLAKTGGRSIETTNAPKPGQGSVAEMSHDYYEQILAGTSFDAMLLFDSREVVVEDIYGKTEECTKDNVFDALKFVYGDAAADEGGWIDLERIWAEINDPATTENDARRYYFNQRRADELQWIKDTQWAKARLDTSLKKSDRIVLGYQGAEKSGAAAIVALRPSDGALFLVGLWEKPADIPDNVAWEVPAKTVDARMRKWLKKEQTRYLVANPWSWIDVVGRWSVDHEDMVEEVWLNQPLKQAKMVDNFQEALLSEKPRVHHSSEPGLSRHILNAHLEEVTHGFILRKEKPHSRRYIAAAQAAILALEAAQCAREKGLLDDPVDDKLYTF